jgi:hypothetical protein
MIKFKTYEKESEFSGLYTYEELLRDFEKERGPFTLYGGFPVKKTIKGDLICKDLNIDSGRLGVVTENLFETPSKPRVHIFWFRTVEAASRFINSHSVDEDIFDNSEPTILNIPKTSIFKDWDDKI